MDNESMKKDNMSNCKACSREIAKGVKKCPHCGKDQRNFFMRHKFLTGFLVLILLASFGGSSDNKDLPKSGGVSDSEQNDMIQQDAEEDVEDDGVQSEFKVNEIISYKDFDLIFENVRNVNSITSGSYLVIDATITSKKDNLKFFGDIQGVTDDNEVVDDTIAFVSEDLGDPIMTSWTKTLNEGQKATGYVAFDKDIAVMEVRSSSFSNDVITILFD